MSLLWTLWPALLGDNYLWIALTIWLLKRDWHGAGPVVLGIKMTTYARKIALLRNQAKYRGELFELTIDEFKRWEPGQLNKLALFRTEGHRHVWRIDPDKPWSLSNIQWREELREIKPLAQTGRPKGRIDRTERRRRSPASADLIKQRAARAREKQLTMSEAQLQCIARRFEADADGYGIVLTKAQWVAELRAAASEKQPKSGQIHSTE